MNLSLRKLIRMKTLVIILHYNTPDLTDSLYESLSPCAGQSYDLFVLDNGSDSDKKSCYHSLETGENKYFGGALNWSFEYVLKNDEYDSLLFLNSDIIVSNSDIVNLLREEMFQNEFTLLSPSVNEISSGGNVGCPQIQNWNTNSCRTVCWIDFQCPMFHRKLIEKIGKFDDQLKHGYGQHLICGFLCEEQNWKIGVTDKLTVEHIGSATMKQERVMSEYQRIAWKKTIKYFRNYMGGKYRLKRKKYLSYAKKYSV